ncbi:MAG: lysostaphin resistance A-like protein [Planctomycetota bacterium]|jgi:membrane protease YdiL (CAAX protease family)
MDDRREPETSEAPPAWGPEGAFLFIAVDFMLIFLAPRSWVLPARFGAVFVFSLILLGPLKAKPAHLGLCLGRIGEGFKISALSVGIASLLTVLGIGVYLILHTMDLAPELPPPARGPTSLWLEAAVRTVLLYPILEEWIYRGVLYFPLEHRVGRRGAIILSGLVFQSLHLAYGVPWPHYFIGGMILAWAYARGRSLLYPIFLHALWNLFILGTDWARGAGWF